MCRGSGRRVTQGNHHAPGCYRSSDSGRPESTQPGGNRPKSHVTCITSVSAVTLVAQTVVEIPAHTRLPESGPISTCLGGLATMCELSGGMPDWAWFD